MVPRFPPYRRLHVALAGVLLLLLILRGGVVAAAAAYYGAIHQFPLLLLLWLFLFLLLVLLGLRRHKDLNQGIGYLLLLPVLGGLPLLLRFISSVEL